MSYPWIIWCRQRTGGISLFHSLSSVSQHPPAEIEPFDFGYGPDRQFTHVGKTLTPGKRDSELRAICDRRLLIKHCYENLSPEFNHALAEIATRAGYRHIHLYRRNEIARLISKGIAEQHGTWGADATTRAKYRQLETTRQQIALDIPALKQYHEQCEARWTAIKGLLYCYGVAFEDLIYIPDRTLSRLAAYIGVSSSAVSIMRNKLGNGHNTSSIWKLIPNLEELKQAIQGEK